jgi:hypothetical protein
LVFYVLIKVHLMELPIGGVVTSGMGHNGVQAIAVNPDVVAAIDVYELAALDGIKLGSKELI